MSQATQAVRKLGAAPFFFIAISTILGAVMFLRFGFAVGNVGFIGTLVIILVGHAVTIPLVLLFILLWRSAWRFISSFLQRRLSTLVEFLIANYRMPEWLTWALRQNKPWAFLLYYF